jgi:hypothetical protein
MGERPLSERERELDGVSFLGKRIDERWHPVQWMMEGRPFFSLGRQLERELGEGSFLEKQIDERC